MQGTRDPSKTSIILVVEDEADLREIMAAGLRMDGYRVLTAEGGHAAFELLLQNDVQAIISDIRMPEGDGLELLARVKTREKTTGHPIQMIMMTGFLNIPRKQILAQGAKEVLIKPFLPEELAAALAPDYVPPQVND